MNRVVITGMGILSPIGNNIEEYREALAKGKNGIAPISAFDTSDFEVKLAGELKGVNFEDRLSKNELRRNDPYAYYALYAAREAAQNAGLYEAKLDRQRCGVYIGSGIGGMQTLVQGVSDLKAKGNRRVSPFLIPAMISNMAAGLVAMDLKFQGPTLPVVTACATSAHSIGEAYRNIRHGYSDIIMAGGSEASITPLATAGFSVLKALSKSQDPKRASIPFDEERSGFVMGEGAAMLVLEELSHAQARGAKIYGEICGYGNSCDAHHITAPLEDGSGSALAIQEALKEANISVEQAGQGYFNAHGTSTKLNDAAESAAILKVFEDHARELHISSTKSMTGHLLGACGAAEAIACILALAEQKVWPTINLKNSDANCPLNYTPGQSQSAQLNWALSNNLGFGGHNASLVFRPWQDPGKEV